MARSPNGAYAWFRSLGLNEEEANKTIGRIERSLLEGTIKLTRLSRGIPNDKKNGSIVIHGISDNLLAHILMPEWKRFIATLSSVTASRGTYFHLTFVDSVLDGNVSDMLLDALKGSPLQRLFLENCQKGLRFARDVLKVNSTLQSLGIELDSFESKYSAIAFVRNLIDHPSLTSFGFDSCGVGLDNSVCAAIIPVLGRIQEVSLSKNCISSRGATLIANFLATNPCVRQLDLDENQLNDRDASKLAASLKTNANLRRLTLQNNMITTKGVNILVDAMVNLNTGSLNALVDCNHTCAIDIIPTLNRHDCPGVNMIVKVGAAIDYCIEYIEEVPIELFPRLCALVQGGSIVEDDDELNTLHKVFVFIRRWNERLFTPSSPAQPGPSAGVNVEMSNELNFLQL
jgi:hypothetical protein